MKLKIYDISPLKNFFDLIFDSSSEVELKLDQDKLSISLLNDSHIAFYNIEFDEAFFDEYSIEENGESVLIFVEDFYKILKSSNKDDVLTIETDDNSMKCIFEHDLNTRMFELPLSEDYRDTPQPPLIDYDGEFIVSLSDLKQPCADLDKIIKTDRFKMVVKDGEMDVLSPADVMTKYSQRIPIDTSIDATTTVNLGYIQDLQKLSKISNLVTLKIGDNIPLTWCMESYDGLVKVGGLVAPILEENE